jgi:hypothetical protein
MHEKSLNLLALKANDSLAQWLKRGGQAVVALIDDLRDGQVIEVSLSPYRLNPAPFDVEGDGLGLLGGIARLFQGGFAALPPGDDLRGYRGWQAPG